MNNFVPVVKAFLSGLSGHPNRLLSALVANEVHFGTFKLKRVYALRLNRFAQIKSRRVL